MFGWLRRRKLRKEVSQALEDGRLDNNESALLRARSEELGLEAQDFTTALTDELQVALAPIKDRIETTRRFSPDDETEMLELAQRYKVGLTFDDLHWRFRQFWAAEHGETLSPRPVEASFLLQPREACYVTTPSAWKQMKTIKHKLGARGLVSSIRIMKGLSYRISGMKPIYQSEEVLASVSIGEFSITNKRIVFEGDRKSTTIKFGSIVDYGLYSDGIEIRKSRGPNEIFILSKDDVEYSALIISHFLSQG
jgi:hypothetical protein